MIRRQFLTGALAALAMPAVVRTPGLLMPVRRVLPDILAAGWVPWTSERWESERKEISAAFECIPMKTAEWDHSVMISEYLLLRWQEMERKCVLGLHPGIAPFRPGDRP